MAVVGFTALIIMFICIVSDFIFSGGLVFLAIGAVSALILIISGSFKKQPVLAYICAAMIFAGVLLMSESLFGIDTAKELYGSEHSVTAVVTDDSYEHNNSNSYVLKTKTVDGQKVKENILVYSKTSFDFEVGDTVSFKAKLLDNTSKNDFSSRLSAIANKEYIYAFLSSSIKVNLVEKGNGTIQHFLHLIRSRVKQGIYSFLSGEEGAVTVAMLIGDKSDISSELKNSFSDSGISHLFAVSGLHLSVWIMSLYTLLKKFTKRRRLPEIISIIFTLFFAALTGFTASVCRAGLMLVLVLISKIVDEDNDSLNSLGIAVFVILIANPMTAVSVSLLLSFCATLGIITAFPPVECKISQMLFTVKNKRVKEIIKYFVCLMAISFCASLFTLPVTSFFIGKVSIIAPVTNMLVSLAATSQMILGGVTSLLLPVKFLARPCAFLCGILAKYVIFVANFLSDIPYCSVKTDSVYFRVALIIILTGIICTVMLIKDSKKRLISSVCIVLSVAVLSGVSFLLLKNDTTSVKIFNTDGMTIQISNGSHNVILGCGGSERYPQDDLDFQNIEKADLLLLPDRNENNSSMYMYFIENCNPEIVVSGEENQSVGLMRNDYKIAPNFQFIPWENSSIEFVKIGKNSFAKFKENDTEILIIFSLNNSEKIPEEFLESDILIVSDSVPEDFDFSMFNSVIVSSTKKGTAKTINNINNQNILTVCDFADVEISLNKNEEVKYFYDER